MRSTETNGNRIMDRHEDDVSYTRVPLSFVTGNPTSFPTSGVLAGNDISMDIELNQEASNSGPDFDMRARREVYLHTPPR